MDFDWRNPSMEFYGDLKVQEIEESFDDPFAVRLLPDSERFADQSRYFNLGRSANGNGIFSVYRTNGKQAKIVGARLFEPEEAFFYKRRVKQMLD